jgi:hypothetical protein
MKGRAYPGIEQTDHPALIKTPHAAMVPCPRRPRFLRKWEENKKENKKLSAEVSAQIGNQAKPDSTLGPGRGLEG